MCGIVGYTGQEQALPILLDGLSKLEYRGYDSAGVALSSCDYIQVEKSKGRINILKDKIKGKQLKDSTTGIGHTRWATHGEPSDQNSHPHIGMNKKVAVVHNGIIENYMQIKNFLIKKGYLFASDTDTEVIAHLTSYFMDKEIEKKKTKCSDGECTFESEEIIKIVEKVVDKLEGSYALAFLFNHRENEIIATRKDNPLVVGVSDKGNFIASDIPAILNYTRDVVLLKDREIALLSASEIKVFSAEGSLIENDITHIDWNVSSAEKCGYDHFMMKEMMEQPKAVADTLVPKINENEIDLSELNLNKEYLESIDKIYIVACGSAYHVGVAGKYIIEEMCRKSVEADLASEFRYRKPLVTENSLVIIISQSGETADSLAALREAKKHGAKVLSIVNCVGSSIARMSDHVLYTRAGPEIAVATTKAYTTQLVTVYMLSVYMSKILNSISDHYAKHLIKSLLSIPRHIQHILENHDNIKAYAKKYKDAKNIFFIGRKLDYAIAMEGSLKLKEISYIHSEAYAAGELKHGSISLIEDGTLIIAPVTQKDVIKKTLSNMKEVKARGAHILAIGYENNEELSETADMLINIPDIGSETAPILCTIYLQLFAYYMAVERECDVDKPRNLAKSVTVE